MAKQSINIGATANDRTGDSLRAAFTKVNENFTELYTALGLTDTTLNLGAFEFTGSVMTTTDSSAITIDQATTISSNLTVGGDILPSVNLGGSLGSPTHQWRSLYVSTNTIYINNVPLSLDGSNNIIVNGSPISSSINYASIPNAPTDIADLTDLTNLLSGGTGDIGFENNYIYHISNGDIWIDPSNDNGSTGYIIVPGPTTADTTPLVIENQMAGGIRFSTNGSNWTLDSNAWLNVPGNRGLRGSVDEDIMIQALDYDDDGFSVKLEVLDDTDTVLSRYKQERDQFELGFPSTGKYFQFNEDGIAWMPGNINGAYGESISIQIPGASGTSSVSLRTIDNTDTLRSDITVDISDVTISTSTAANTWTFGSDGILTLPGTGTIRTAFGAMSINAPSGSSNLSIKSNDATTYMIVGNGSAGVTVGSYNWQFSNTGNLTFPNSTVQTTAWTGNFGYLTAETDTIKGTAGYTYTFNYDGYFTSSQNSESTGYFFVPYNSTNLNIAAGWTVVGANCDTTVSSTVYPVAGYPNVIKVNLTAAASSTSGFYPVVVTSPDRLKVEIQPNPGNASKFSFATTGITFPDSTVQTTAYPGFPTVSTVSSTTQNYPTTSQDIIFCDPTTAGGDVSLNLPDAPPEGKIYTIKNISAGNTYVGAASPAAAIETEFGLYSTGAYITINVKDAFITLVFSNGGYRIIGRYGI